MAADFAVDGSFGTPAGCAVLAKSTDVPSGKAYGVSTDKMVNVDKTCAVLSSIQAADGQSWDVKISCQLGDDLPEAGTVNVTPAEDNSTVTVKVVDGSGPKGTLKACKQG